jgi:hypothetical protein
VAKDGVFFGNFPGGIDENCRHCSWSLSRQLNLGLQKYVAKVLTYLLILTYLRSCALLEKLQIMQLLKNFPAFCGTRRFITLLQEPSTGPYPEPDRTILSHPISLGSI